MVTNLLGMKNIKYFALAAFLGTLATACKKDVFDSTVQLKRQFLPTNIKITAGETAVQLNWSPALFTVPGKVSYTVLVSTDSTFQSSGIITKVTDTSGVKLTDDELQVRTKYFALVKANGAEGTEDSRWGLSPSFRITGEQIFSPILTADLKDKSVILRWKETTGLTKISLQSANGAPIDIALDQTDVSNKEKAINGLSPSTLYNAEIFAGNKSKGTISFSTKEPSIFTIELNSGDDLAAAVNNAVNGDVIGLHPGVYDFGTTTFEIRKKHLVLQSVSGNPANTKVVFKEFKMKGTGAGIKFAGIEFDGNNSADYFINLVGENSDAEAAQFTSITVDNCIVKNTKNCALRGNRAANLDHKIDFVKFTNSVFKDNGGSYTYLTLAKMDLKKVDLENSTFSNIGRALIMWDTNVPISAVPNININRCTMANFGARNHTILDAGGNNINFLMENSILVNIKSTGGTSMLRAGGGGSLAINNSNLFNLNSGATPPVESVFPAIVGKVNVLAIDLGWTATQSDFTLPIGSPLRTAGTSGGALGDSRWH